MVRVPVADAVFEDVERYAEAHTTPPGPFLARLAEETKATLPMPETGREFLVAGRQGVYWSRRAGVLGGVVCACEG